MMCTAWSGHQPGLPSHHHQGVEQTSYRLTTDISSCLLIISYELFNPSVTVPPRFSWIGQSYVQRSTLKLTHIISLAPFLDAAAAYQASSSSTQPRVPWAEWGPRYSRTICTPKEVLGSGSRVLVRGDGIEDRVWDFNIRLNRRYEEDTREATKGFLKRWSPAATQNRKIRFVGVDQPTVIEKGDFLEEDVVGTLPYYATLCQPPGSDGTWQALVRGSPFVMVVSNHSPWEEGGAEVCRVRSPSRNDLLIRLQLRGQLYALNI